MKAVIERTFRALKGAGGPGVWIALLGLGVAAALLMAFLTPYGMGLVNDSVGYVAGARNLLAGDGYSRLTGDGSPRPITNFPPFYSIVLALFMLTGLDGLQAAWWVNILAFGLCSLLAGLLAWRLSGQGAFGLLAGFLFAISEPMLRVFSFAFSEPIFLVVYFLAFFSLAKYLAGGRRLWLAAAAFCAGLCVLARYAGVSLFATAALCLLLFSNNWKRFFGDMAIFLALGLPPLAAWTVRNTLVTGNPANRQLLWHPIPPEKLQEALTGFWRWLLPERPGLIERFFTPLGLAFAAVMLALLAVTLWLSLRRRRAGDGVPLERLTLWTALAIQAFTYPAVLLFSLSFVDASSVLDDRLLLPFYSLALLLGVGLLAWLWQSRKRWLRVAVLAAVIALAASFSRDALAAVDVLHGDGQGLASSYWRSSPTVGAARRLPGVTLYSNKVNALYLLAERPAYILPSPLNPATNQPRPGYRQDVESIRGEVLDGRAVIVVFDYRGLLDSPEDRDWMLEITGGLPLLVEYEDGALFGRQP